MAFRILFSASTTSLNVSGLAGRKLLEDLHHHGMRRLDAPVQGLAAIGRVKAIAVRKGGADALQDALRVERPRDGVGRAQRPGLHRAVMQRIGEHEQPRHLAIGFGPQLVAHPLHALGGAQIDVDHDPGEIARRRVGNFRRRDGVDLADRLQNAGQFAGFDRFDPMPAAAGAWTKSCWLKLSWTPEPCGSDRR